MILELTSSKESPKPQEMSLCHWCYHPVSSGSVEDTYCSFFTTLLSLFLFISFYLKQTFNLFSASILILQYPCQPPSCTSTVWLPDWDRETVSKN